MIPIVHAVIVFDPSREPEGDTPPGMTAEDHAADARLVYYYAQEYVDISEKRNQANLVQGVCDFALFCSNNTASPVDPVEIETDHLLFLVEPLVGSARLCIIFEKQSISVASSKKIIKKFLAFHHLLHKDLLDLKCMEDFVPCFVAAECGSPNCCFDIGIRYAPVERHSLVAAHAIGLELVHDSKNLINHFAIGYKGFLVSSSLAPDLLAPLYTYLFMDMSSGSVSNTKLLKPPYGRIGTPAVVPGGGSSAFGRCNFVDPDSDGPGFLFGPTGAGVSAFCPLVHLNDGSEHHLCVYMVNNVIIVLLLKSGNDYELFKRIETYFTANNSFNEEVLPLIRSDFTKSKSIGSGNASFDFTYRNNINKSIIMNERASDANSFNDKKRSIFSKTFMYPFGNKSNSPTADHVFAEDATMTKISNLAKNSQDISNIAVKQSSNDGWRVFTRRGPVREIDFKFKDPKIPLWKVNNEIDYFIKHKFDSIFL